MIALMMPLLLQATAASPALPSDWSTLAPMPFREVPKVSSAMTAFVANEVATGHCVVPKPADGHYVVSLDIIALVGRDGSVKKFVPRAIQCPTVEQYGVGLVTSFARDNLLLGTGNGDSWYRTTLTFDWTK
jgi:hypothetical protein